MTLHYFVEDPQGRSEEKVEPVKERYQGIYNKEFVLFYGEQLHYYLRLNARGRLPGLRKQSCCGRGGDLRKQ